MIRRPIPEDANAIARVHHDAWHATYTDLLSAETNALKTPLHFQEKWSRILADSRGSRIHVKVDDSNIVTGFVSVGPDRTEGSKIGEVWAIYVHPDVLGSGVGGELFRVGLRELREMGFNIARIRVERGNARARAFYEKFGFTEDCCAPEGCDNDCEGDVAYVGNI